MDLGADRMPGAVDEIVAIAGLLNVPARGPVDLPSGDAAPRVSGIKDGFHSGIPGIAHDLKNIPHASGGRLTYETHPGDVVIDGGRCVFLSPDIEQHQIAFADRHGM